MVFIDELILVILVVLWNLIDKGLVIELMNLLELPGLGSDFENV
jgi:hypothetical protein